MPRCRRIAHQHNILVIPLFANHTRELHPHRRSAQMGGVGNQVMPAQMLHKNPFTCGDNVFLRHMFEAPAFPSFGQALHDERRFISIELINMRPNPAVFSLFKNEGESAIEFLMRAKPNKFATAHINIGLEHLGIFAPHHRADAITSNHQIIVFAIFFGGFELRLKLQVHAQFAGTFLQQDQHLFAANAGKAVAA